MSGKALPSWWSLRRRPRPPSTYPADSSGASHLPPLAALWPCSSCSCKSLAVDHADGCQPQPALDLGPQGGRAIPERQETGWSRGAGQCSLPFKQRLSPCRLNLATGFSAGKGGWSQVTLGQQRGPNSVPQHLLMGNVHSTPPPLNPQPFKSPEPALPPSSAYKPSTVQASD